MDKVEDLMKSLKLSETESRGLKIGWTDGKKIRSMDHEAIAKLLFHRLATLRLGWLSFSCDKALLSVSCQT
jgi:hypothetical protein